MQINLPNAAYLLELDLEPKILDIPPIELELEPVLEELATEELAVEELIVKEPVVKELVVEPVLEPPRAFRYGWGSYSQIYNRLRASRKVSLQRSFNTKFICSTLP